MARRGVRDPQESRDSPRSEDSSSPFGFGGSRLNEVMDEEPESNSSVKFQTCVLCFAGIASIILVWIMVPDFAMQFTLFAIPVTGFIIFAMKKGWLNTGLNGWME